MLRVAITGNIASGKSVVGSILTSKGYSVFDTDEIAHGVLATSYKVRDAFKNFDITFSPRELLHKGQPLPCKWCCGSW